MIQGRFISSVLIAASYSASAAPIFTIKDLGTLGGAAMTASSINSSGQVAGSGQNPSQSARSIEYSAGLLRDITPYFAMDSTASAINDSGLIAGTSYLATGAAATLWDAAGNAAVLPGLGGSDSYATAINSNGMVAGMATTASGAGHPFVYSEGITSDLGLPGDAVWGAAYGVNSSGQVAGYTMNAYGRSSGFVWSYTGYTAIGTLGGAGSYAMAINDQGDVAGHAATGSGYLHAVLYSNGGLTDIGTLGGSSSFAYGINNLDAVVGYSMMAAGGNHAFLYQNGVLFDLNALLASAAGWELTAAYGITDAGQIVGSGILDGAEHAFELDPVRPKLRLALLAPPISDTPEPAAIGLTAIGLLGILGARHYRRKK